MANELDKSVAKVSSRNSFNEEIRVWLKTSRILDNAESKSNPETDEKNEKYLDTKSSDKDGMFCIKLSPFFFFRRNNYVTIHNEILTRVYY